MKNFFFNLSIKFKILLVFYLILGIYSSVYYIYSTRSSSENIVLNVGNANYFLLQQISTNILFMQQEIEDMSTQIILHPEVQNYLKPSYSHGSYSQKLYIDTNLKNAVNLIASKNYVNSLYIVGFNNNTVPFIRTVDNEFKIPSLKKLAETDLYKEAQKANGKPIWYILTSDNTDFINSRLYNQLIMARIVKDYTTYKNVGLLLVAINEPTLEKIYSKGIHLKNSAIAILNEDGRILSNTGMDISDELKQNLKDIKFSQEYFIDKLDNQKVLFSHIKNDENNLIYLYSVPMSLITKQIVSGRNYIMLFFLASLLIILPLLLFASDLIVRPIKKLLFAMRGFQTGDFNSTVEFHYKDEIGQLGKGYNDMVKNTKTLIDQMYVLQIKEQEAELTALQAQIHPHFLYNTLDSIYWKAQKNGQQEIAEMIWYLSKVFRISLNNGQRFNTIEYEFDFLEKYLHLYQLRYKDKISYKISMVSEAKDITIPKLILQPFLENAIKHGLENKIGKGQITVSCDLSENSVIFNIVDDGKGISRNTLEKLKSGAFEGKNETGGYAIKNIQERLSLVYGNNYTLTLNSEIDCGTQLTLILPKNFSEVAMVYDKNSHS